MASLNTTVALAALPDMDVELAVDGLARDLDLELLGDVGFVEGAAAVRADVGQRCLVDFVDLSGGRWLAVGLGAVVLARLAAWFARVRLGLALGEGACLAFAGTEGGVELTAQSLVLGLQVVNPSLEGLAVGTPNRFHTDILRSTGTCSCADGMWRIAQPQVGALIKYATRSGEPKPLDPKPGSTTAHTLATLSQLSGGGTAGTARCGC